MEIVDGVVVVGAGPVGLLTALKLGKAGIRVVVLEAESGILSTTHAIACTPPIITALECFGVLDEVRKRAVLCPDVAYRHADGSLIAKVEWNVLAEDTPHPHLLLLGRNHLCSLIVQQLRTLPTVEIRWNHRVRTLEQDRSSVTIETRSPGGPTRLRSSWVVAADGARSTVREEVGLSFDGSTWPERMVAVDVFYDFNLHGYSRANFVHDPVDWAVVFQLDQTGLWRVCYEEDPTLSEVEARQRVHERLTRLLPGTPTSDQYRIEQVAPYRIEQRCVADFRRGRVLLTGDAAHVSNPMGGLGLSGGVLEAQQLADALIEVINNDAPLSVLTDDSLSRKTVFDEFTSTRSTACFTWMKERGPIQRARDLTLLKQAGTDRTVMRQLLLDFERLNGRRSGSISSRISRLTGASRMRLHQLAQSISGSARASWQSVRFAHKRLLRATSFE